MDEVDYARQPAAWDEREEEMEGERATRPQEAAPPRPLGPYDPGRMRLSEEERTWALEIKQAIEANPELDNLNDFCCAQLALTEEPGDLESTLQRAHHLQEIRQEYNVVDSFECSKRTVHQAFDRFPGHFLSFSFSHQEGNYVIVLDFSKQPTTKCLKALAEGKELKLREVYYLLQAVTPDFEAMRRGHIVMAECVSVDRNQGMNVGMYRSIWHIMLAHPAKLQKFKHFHTGVFALQLVSGTKRILPPHVRSNVEVGCICESGSLDKLYLQPSFAEANQRVLRRLEETLQRRYQNEAEFRL
ncbi:expressed unknown protein [Seminavis robusta]|uniref:Uncharacterized protein n=1 Tax=Seminavis robusta TaxID=568900 RepID=A0A9N8EZD2_9STRA|nr:expressed unknown protein [Seminavis robusta]|eukprot:Sro2305_g322630.1 n/a (301) ;mRNA; r:6825-7727